MEFAEIKDVLDFYSAKINSPEFIADDPVQFPRIFSDQRDIEIMALLSATIAWGKRSMIIKNGYKMLKLMDGQPYKYLMDRGFEELPDMNIHRTFFTDNLRHWLRGLHLIYSQYSSLDEFAKSKGVGQTDYPAVTLAGLLNDAIREANDGMNDPRCLPTNLETTSLKRLNMALRWLVRDDGIVDMGVWHSINPSQLRIPLDVHVSRTARQLGLLSRNSPDRKAVEELTRQLLRMDPADPVRYDYALFGLGVKGITESLL